MSMPGVRTALTPAQRERLGRKGLEPTLHERATIYLLLAEVLTKTSKMADAPEAKKVTMTTAKLPVPACHLIRPQCHQLKSNWHAVASCAQKHVVCAVPTIGTPDKFLDPTC